MNRSEHYLACLAEECDEVGQRCMKALRFGLHEIQVDQPFNNSERISEELRDLIAVATILERGGHLARFQPTKEEVSAKLAKIEKFMKISIREGALTDADK
jgi:NTP pyrophosphatase (non-canonical NTP hydrolase)